MSNRRRRRKKKPAPPLEDSLAAACMHYVENVRGLIAYAIPNAARRTPYERAKVKREGLRAGVPDLCIPLPFLMSWIDEANDSSGFVVACSCYVELKRERPYNAPITENQARWGYSLDLFGNMWAVAHGFDEFRALIDTCYPSDKPQLWKTIRARQWTMARAQLITRVNERLATGKGISVDQPEQPASIQSPRKRRNESAAQPDEDYEPWQRADCGDAHDETSAEEVADEGGSED